MIQDAQVEVTCDGEDCNQNIFCDLEAGTRNNYIADDVKIERQIADQFWIVKNGNHFCSVECQQTVYPDPD